MNESHFMREVPHKRCESVEEMEADFDYAIARKLDVVLDCETNGIDTRWYNINGRWVMKHMKEAGLAYRIEGLPAKYAPIGHRSRGREVNLPREEVAKLVARLLRAAIPTPISDAEKLARPMSYKHRGDNLRIIVHNARFDLDVLENLSGVSLTHPDSFVDTMIRHHILWPSLPHGLKSVAADHLTTPAGIFFRMTTLGQLNYWTPQEADVPDELGEYDEETWARERHTKDFTLTDPTDPETLAYPCADAEATFQLEKILVLGDPRSFNGVRLRSASGQPIDEDGQLNVDLQLERIDKRLVAALRQMERWRIRVDKALVDQMLKISDRKVFKALKALRRLARTLGNHDFNPNSGPQLQALLYERLAITPAKRVKPKKREVIEAEVRCAGDCDVDLMAARRCKCCRNPAVDKDALNKLLVDASDPEQTRRRRRGRTFVKHMLQYRQHSKLITTYLNKLAGADEEDTVRFSLSPFKVSGRMSAPSRGVPGGVPIHGFPKGKKTDIPLRHLFIARPNYVLVAIDFSAQEMVIVTVLSQEPFWLKSFFENIDPHSQMANVLFGQMDDPTDDSTPEYREKYDSRRDQAKINLFAILYGSEPPAIAERLGIPLQEAEEIKAKFRTQVPVFFEWDVQNRRTAERYGYVRSAGGRKHHCWRRAMDANGFPVTRIKKHVSTNMRVQGTGSDILRKALVAYHELAEVRGWNATGHVKALQPVHDEIVFEIRQDLVDEVIPQLHACMLRPFADVFAKTPLKLKTTVGADWASEKKWVPSSAPAPAV